MLSSATWSCASFCGEGLLSPLFLRDVRHHGHGAAQRRPSAENAVDPAVRRAVLEALARGIAQALHALGNLGLHVAVAVIAVLGETSQEIQIGAPGLKQLVRHLVHLFETIVAEDDLQIVVSVDERPRHVVEGETELALHPGRLGTAPDDLVQCHQRSTSCAEAAQMALRPAHLKMSWIVSPR